MCVCVTLYVGVCVCIYIDQLTNFALSLLM